MVKMASKFDNGVDSFFNIRGMQDISDEQLVAAAAGGSIVLACAGGLYVYQALSHGKSLLTVLHDVKEEAGSMRQGAAAEEVSAEAARKYVKGAIEKVKAFNKSASLPLAIGAAAVGTTASLALASRLYDRGQLDFRYGATTALPGILLLASIPAAGLFKVKIPGLAWFGKVQDYLSAMERWPLPLASQVRSLSHDIKQRLDSVADANPRAATAIQDMMTEAKELEESAWASAPGILTASGLGLLSALLLSPNLYAVTVGSGLGPALRNSISSSTYQYRDSGSTSGGGGSSYVAAPRSGMVRELTPGASIEAADVSSGFRTAR